jgi:imidazolonepropionase
MPLVIGLSVAMFGLSVNEALRAATLGGAAALRVSDRGALAPGMYADIVLWDADHEGAFAWAFGLRAQRVWRGGVPVQA